MSGMAKHTEALVLCRLTKTRWWEFFVSVKLLFIAVAK